MSPTFSCYRNSVVFLLPMMIHAADDEIYDQQLLLCKSQSKQLVQKVMKWKKSKKVNWPKNSQTSESRLLRSWWKQKASFCSQIGAINLNGTSIYHAIVSFFLSSFSSFVKTMLWLISHVAPKPLPPNVENYAKYWFSFILQRSLLLLPSNLEKKKMWMKVLQIEPNNHTEYALDNHFGYF